MSTILFTQTAQKKVENTVTATSMVGTGVGNLTLPANFWIPGRTVKVSFSGTLAATTSPTAVVKLKLGSTSVVESSVQTLPTIVGACDFYGTAKIVCRSKYNDLTEVGGTLMSDMEICFGLDTAGSAVDAIVAPPLLTSSFDTRASAAVDVTFQWGAADALNVATVEVFTVEVL